jgi:hypothetical protein
METYQFAEKSDRGAQKDLRDTLANYKDESGAPKAEFSFQLSSFIFSKQVAC